MMWNPNKMTRNLHQAIVYKFKQFCKHYTLHGVYYFYQNSSSWLHFIWIFIIGSSMCLCVYLSHLIWLKFVDNPTFTVVESTHYSIDSISFPAISICDSKIVYGPNTNNFTWILNLRGYDQEKINNFFSSFDDVKNNDYVPENYIKKMHMVLEHLGYTYNILLDQLSAPCHILIRKCMWRSKAVKCSRMFRKVFTVMGYCCQFDMTHFRAHAEENTKFEAGEEVWEALDVTVNTQIKLANGTFVDSFLYLYVSDSQNKLTLLDSSITITGAAFFDVIVAVWAIDSSEDVKRLSLTNRKCFLPVETKKDADFYQGCITLHIMQEVVSQCRCIPFNFESAELDVEDFPACTWEKIKCIYNMLVGILVTTSNKMVVVFKLSHETIGIGNIIEDFATLQIDAIDNLKNFYALEISLLHSYELHFIRDKVQSHVRYIIAKHECYQNCDYVQYETKSSYVNIDGNRDQAESRVTVHYADSTYIKYRQEVLYTWDQMLANLGGIFGLCFGGSIVSIIELLWFLLELLFFVIGLQRNKVMPNNGKKPAIFTLKNIESSNKINCKYPYYN